MLKPFLHSRGEGFGLLALPLRQNFVHVDIRRLKISAMAGIPVVDAPCNGRAHPLALIGSLGLHRFPKHRTWTAAVGGAHRPDEPINQHAFLEWA